MKSPQADEGTLGRIYIEVMRRREEMRSDGATSEAIEAFTEKATRGAWPTTREWHYTCDDCSDTGWFFGTCTKRTPCGRPFKFPGQHSDDYTGQGRCSPNHSYVRACHCLNGERRRANLERRPAPDDFQQAGKSKPKQMSRFGR